LRAKQSAELLADLTGLPLAEPEPDLAELRAGALEGLTRDEMAERHPTFLQRAIDRLADFAEFGGEGYDEVQARARRLLDKLERLHRSDARRVLLVGHGGINFQLVKLMVCEPVPRVCILRMGNCSATLVRMRDRRGRYLGEVVWHVPLELMTTEATEGEGVANVFR
jgi:broad specificity phosphatase PhoE